MRLRLPLVRTLLPTLLGVAFAFASPSAHGQLMPDDTLSTDEAGWRGLAAPYALANSDEGILAGIGAGVGKGHAVYLLASTEVSTLGNLSNSLEGEVEAGSWRYVGKVDFSRKRRYIYPAIGADPGYTATAFMENLLLNLSMFRTVAPHLEFGPSVSYEHSLGLRPEDADGSALDLARIDRFRPGGTALAGVRLRRRTTSAVRPTNGTILDLTLQGGVAEFATWTQPRGDGFLRAFAAIARPLRPHLRYYLRGEADLQLQAPPPVQGYIGGEKRVRGQPDRRDFGRRTLFGRAQLHWTFWEKFRLPFQVVHAIVHKIPVWPVQLEFVPFFDIGAANDPAYGWRETRLGYGAGLHVVLPPELVGHIDIATTPGGGTRFYIGIGETL